MAARFASLCARACVTKCHRAFVRVGEMRTSVACVTCVQGKMWANLSVYQEIQTQSLSLSLSLLAFLYLIVSLTEKVGAFRGLSHGVVADIEKEIVVHSVHVIILARLLHACERWRSRCACTCAPVLFFFFEKHRGGKGVCRIPHRKSCM